MRDVLLDKWSASPVEDQVNMVIPDGCRDLIIKTDKDQKSHCHVSPLFDQTKMIVSAANTTIKGYRLYPGVKIDANGLVSSVNNEFLDDSETIERINDFVSINTNVSEAIECFSYGAITVKNASKKLGVSQRTLQRFILKETERSPSYWIRLARVRRAARDILTVHNAELAYLHGYYDQAHLCREIRCWFGTSISQLKESHDFHNQINDIAYA